MNTNEYFKLAIRNKYFITIITLICLFSSYSIYTIQNKLFYDNTLIVNLAVENQKNIVELSPYDNLQAADQFAESIQGWLIAPSILTEINQKSHLDYDLKAKKQEKNNVVISYSSDSLENSQLYYQQIVQSLQNKLNLYNQKSDLRINMAFADLHTEKNEKNPALYLLIGLIIGISLSYLFAWLWEILNDQIQSLQVLRDIFQKEPLDNYKGRADMVKNHVYLSKLITHYLKGHDLQIIDQTRIKRFAIESISKYTHYENYKTNYFPIDIEHIKTNKPTLLMVELGYTRISALKRINNLHIENLEILVMDKLP